MMKFAAKPFQGVSVEGGGKTARIVFSKQCKPCTVMPLDPVAPGSHAYEVVMPVKQGRTSLGWQPTRDNTVYMMSDYREPDKKYVSYGGMGFMYPMKKVGSQKYAVGDRVRVELDLSPDGTGTARYSVNGKFSGEHPWTLGPQAYPAFSCESGETVMDVTWVSDC
uniref:B30.2/SPRY domain-containing protein n=1 Tax=Chlamydomonas leiostraca TaxID=1034604 RepID=A0A7S0S1D6_9CHLO